ncbi:MAG: response regulator [Turneriella sp.]
MQLIVIEDDEVQHELLRALLSQIGVAVIFSTTGEDGLEKIRNHHFDAVLLDLGLPGKSGVQVLKTIRDSAMTRDLPVMILTADHSRETLLLCMKLGISDYIAKPFHLQHFALKMATLKRMLALRSSTGAGAEAAKVMVERQAGLVKFIFGGLFNDDSVRRFLSLYTPVLKTQTKSDEVLLNLAALPNLNDPQLRMFQLICKALEPKKPLIVAGRSYGPLIGVIPDFESRLFITEEDALDFLSRRK